MLNMTDFMTLREAVFYLWLSVATYCMVPSASQHDAMVRPLKPSYSYPSPG